MAPAAARAPAFDRDYAGVAERYARDVVAGRVLAGKLARAACKRHLEDLKRARRDKAWGYRFDTWHAGDVCDFVEKLPHVQGDWCNCPGKRRGEHSERCGLIDLEPPQVFILAVIFGWRRTEDGLRRFSTAYIEMARKGAKSTLTAGVALYCLACEDEVGPEIYVGATTGAQAQKVFAPAQGMARKRPDLREAFDLTVWAKSITCGQNSGFIQTINAKGSTNDGHNPHVAILDELHAHARRDLFDVMQSAMGARKNPLMWVITTAGFNMAGVCYEQRTYVAKVLEGVLVADHVFGIVFCIDEEDDPYDERVWRKANPMLGVTPTLKKMREYAADAQASPAAEGNFKTKNLNLWLNAASAWLNMAQWKACASPELGWDDFDGLECFIGGDLADKDDITALALCAFRPSPTLAGQTQLLLKPMFWLPEAVLKDPKHAEGRGAAPYAAWAKAGHLQLTEGDWVDHGEIEKIVRAWRERYGARKFTGDQFAAMQAMASRLNRDLASPDDPFAQILHKSAANITDAAREFEARLNGGPARLLHDANPVMTWMASNVTVSRRRDGTLLPIKETPMSANKIDGIDAALNGIAPAVMTTEEGPTMQLSADCLVLI